MCWAITKTALVQIRYLDCYAGKNILFTTFTREMPLKRHPLCIKKSNTTTYFFAITPIWTPSFLGAQELRVVSLLPRSPTKHCFMLPVSPSLIAFLSTLLTWKQSIRRPLTHFLYRSVGLWWLLPPCLCGKNELTAKNGERGAKHLCAQKAKIAERRAMASLIGRGRANTDLFIACPYGFRLGTRFALFL